MVVCSRFSKQGVAPARPGWCCPRFLVGYARLLRSFSSQVRQEMAMRVCSLVTLLYHHPCGIILATLCACSPWSLLFLMVSCIHFSLCFCSLPSFLPF